MKAGEPKEAVDLLRKLWNEVYIKYPDSLLEQVSVEAMVEYRLMFDDNDRAQYYEDKIERMQSIIDEQYKESEILKEIINKQEKLNKLQILFGEYYLGLPFLLLIIYGISVLIVMEVE